MTPALFSTRTLETGSLLVALALTSPAFGMEPTVNPSDDGAAPAPTRWGDFDGDAFRDALVLGADGRVSLQQNMGDGSFADVTDVTGLADLPKAAFLLFEDFDGDGLSDIFVGEADGGASLLRNHGFGFSAVGSVAGLPLDGVVTGAHFVDYDADGRLDMHVVTDRQNVMLHALGRGAFEAIGLQPVVGDADGHGGLGGGLTGGPAMGGEAGGGDAGGGDHDGADVSNGVGANGDGSGVRAGPPPFAGGPSATSAPLPLVTGGALDVRPGGVIDGSRSEAAPGQAASLGCFGAIADSGASGCLQASSVPTLGMLYPLSENLFVDAATDRVGIGTLSPLMPLHLQHASHARALLAGGHTSLVMDRGLASEQSVIHFKTDGDEDWTIGMDNAPALNVADYAIKRLNNGQPDLLVRASDGHVGIATGAPEAALHIAGTADSQLSPLGHGLLVTGDVTGTNITMDQNEIMARDGSSASELSLNREGGDVLIAAAGAGRVGIGTSTPATTLDVDGAITIRGGADIVETFESSCGVLEPGTVVAIDPDRQGMLMCSVVAYDTKVAGVVSGAGGVNPGLLLGQDELFAGDTKVAMTGRVYVKCSTENGPIVPGDRLTTATLGGHAMKVTDGARSVGAVIGKAMSSLESGSGLVLVLVNLQ